MTKIVEILLERGGLLGVVVVALAWTAIRLYKDLAQERAAYQLALQAKDSAGDVREATLQAELRALHDKHKDDQRRATEAMQSLNDRVYEAVDRMSDLLERTQQIPSSTRSPQPRQQAPPTARSRWSSTTTAKPQR